MIEIIQAETAEHIEHTRTLFREYEKWFGMNLCFQNFDEEVATLPGKYKPPDGRLFLAFADGKLAGCIALRKLEDQICEMKRLFVREDFRGLGIGKILIEKLIARERRQSVTKRCGSTPFRRKCRKLSNFTIHTAFTKSNLIITILTAKRCLWNQISKNKKTLTAEEG